MPSDSFSKCGHDGCAELAISFSDSCWAHADQLTYLAKLRSALVSLSGSIRLNLAKTTLEDIDFSRLNLSESSFSQARLTRCYFVGTELTSTDWIGSRVHSCDFVGSDMRDSNLTRASISAGSFAFSDLSRAYLSEAHFRETDFMGSVLHEAVLWDADLSGVKHLKKKSFQSSDKLHSIRLSEKNKIVAFESYRTVKHHFYAKGLYEDASWAGYRELTMERKHFFETRNPRYVPSLLMNLLSGYTENPYRVILSSFVLVFLFAVVYFIFNVPRPSSGPDHPASFVDCLYFSFITFTTVGYGDFAPRAIAWFRLLACTEAFSGPFMAGLYIFTLTRRYATG